MLGSLDGKLKLVNLGNPYEQTVLSLAEKVIELTGSKSKMSFDPLPQDDPLMRKPDISLAKEVLNWSSRNFFRNWFKKNN